MIRPSEPERVRDAFYIAVWEVDAAGMGKPEKKPRSEKRGFECNGIERSIK